MEWFFIIYSVLLIFKSSDSLKWRDPHEVILSAERGESNKWRDPHEINVGTTGSERNTCPISDETLLRFYKRSISLMISHARKSNDNSDIYEIRATISKENYDQLLVMLNENFNIDLMRKVDSLLSNDVFAKTQYDELDELALDVVHWTYRHLCTTNVFILLFSVYAFYSTYTVKSFKRRLMSILFLIWVADFALTWSDEFENKELDKFIKMKEYESAPPNCDITRMNWFERFWYTTSSVSECAEYYKTTLKTTQYGVGPIDVTILQIKKYLQIIRYVGGETAALYAAIHGVLPFPYNIIVTPIIFLIVILLIMFCIFCYMGYSFKLNIAHIFNFAISKNESNTDSLKDTLHTNRLLIENLIEKDKPAKLNCCTKKRLKLSGINTSSLKQSPRKLPIGFTSGDDSRIGSVPSVSGYEEILEKLDCPIGNDVSANTGEVFDDSSIDSLSADNSSE